MTKSEITRLLAMIAHEDGDPDTFSFVLNRIFGAFQGRDASKWYDCAHCDAGYPDQECTCKENEE